MIDLSTSRYLCIVYCTIMVKFVVQLCIQLNILERHRDDSSSQLEAFKSPTGGIPWLSRKVGSSLNS